MKTLNDAIGCWTVNPDYNSLPELAKGVRQQTRGDPLMLRQRDEPLNPKYKYMEA